MSKKRPRPIEAPPPGSAWDAALGAVACLMAFTVPFYPDEKLARLKLEALELHVLVLTAIAGVRFITNRHSGTSLAGIDLKDGKVGPGQRHAGTTAYLWAARVPWAVAIWAAVGAALWALSAERSVANAELRRIILAAATFAVFAFPGLSAEWRPRFLWCAAASAGLLAAYGLLQVTGGIGPVAVPQMDRVMGTSGNPIFFAAFLTGGLFMSAAAYRLARHDGARFLIFVSIALQAAALYFTRTRAAWLAVGAALALGQFWKHGFRRVPPGLLVGIVLAAGAFGFATREIWLRDQGHALIWRDTLRMAADHPLKGVGLGAFHTNFPAYAGDDLKAKWPQGQSIVNYAHNEYLQMLVEGGVFYLLAFFGILFCFFRFAFSAPPGSPGVRPEDPWLTLGAFALIVQNVVSVDMRYGISLATLFTLMSLRLPAPGVAAPAEPGPGGRPLRAALALGWVAFLGAVVLPALLKPYRAQKAVVNAPGFFDERLLDPAKSIADLEKLAADYPKEPAVLEKLAYVYAKEMRTADNRINRDMTEKAIRAYERLIEVDPKRMSAYNNLANIHYTTGQVDAAVAMWERALTVDPDFIDVHLNLGKIYYVQGRLKESAAHFEQVLRLQPGNNEAIVYLKRMVE